MNTATVYRVGPLRSGPHSPSLEKLWTYLDSHKPTSHPVGRIDAIYTSPTILSMYRWLDNLVYNLAEDAPVYALTVDADALYAYSIPSYEKLEKPHLRRGTTPPEEDVVAYWNDGAPLGEWNAKRDELIDGTGYSTEILLPQDGILDIEPLHVPEMTSMLQGVIADDLVENLFSHTWAITCSCCQAAA